MNIDERLEALAESLALMHQENDRRAEENDRRAQENDRRAQETELYKQETDRRIEENRAKRARSRPADQGDVTPHHRDVQRH